MTPERREELQKIRETVDPRSPLGMIVAESLREQDEREEIALLVEWTRNQVTFGHSEANLRNRADANLATALALLRGEPRPKFAFIVTPIHLRAPRRPIGERHHNECPSCRSTNLDPMFSRPDLQPPVFDEAAWAALAEKHEPDCYWIASRGWRIEPE